VVEQEPAPLGRQLGRRLAGIVQPGPAGGREQEQREQAGGESQSEVQGGGIWE
jgi:hypothetical protein